MLKRAMQVLTPLGAIAATLMAVTSAQAAVLYQVDDGSPNSVFGISDRGCGIANGTPVADLLWLNEFDVEDNANYIDRISLAWGAPIAAGAPQTCGDYNRLTGGLTVGQAAKVLLYDTDAQGNLRLVASQDTQVQDPGTNRFIDVAIDRTRISGRKFYVGALLPNQGQAQFPAPFDTDSNAGRSYYLANIFSFSPGGGGVPPANRDYSTITLSSGNGTIVDRVPGNWLLRAYGSRQVVPEPTAAIALIAIGTGVVLKRRLMR